MSASDTKNKNDLVSRRMYIVSMLSQTLGIETFLLIPHEAVIGGAAGQAITLAVTYIVVGIPLLYMENVVAQFTGRDCLEVWRARTCLSHVGYLHILWQVAIAVYLHTINSFVVHYFLISFEHPIPYYICGPWSKRNCNILKHNYTVNEDCLKSNNPLPYCGNLYQTFPEFQYWRYNMLRLDENQYYLPWRVGLASWIISIVIFLSCFKGRKSLKLVLQFVTIYPICGRFIFMIGSMLQKGLVVKYEAALDSDFSLFSRDFSLSDAISQVLYSLKIGSGLAFGTASRISFRAPCYSDTVIVVIISCSVAILGIFSTAMLICPYAFQYDILPGSILRFPLTNTFEKIPRLLSVYETRFLWLIVCYSFVAVSAMAEYICIISNLLEMVTKRNNKLTKNPVLVAFVISIVLYIGTVPLSGNFCLYFFADMRRVINYLLIFLATIEIFVFVLWYGLEKFSEDVHFMQGVQPIASVKWSWLISAVILIYVFVTQLYTTYMKEDKTIGTLIGCYILLISIVITILVTIVKLLLALYKKKFYDVTCLLDPTWGPNSEILKRSRAMFSAQAMTKEYMYRQYHLQAGILSRQRASNVRVRDNLGDSIRRSENV